MDNTTKLFRKSPLGFNREDVINYIERIKNDFYDYKTTSEKTVSELKEKINELEEALANNKTQELQNIENDDVDFSSSVSKINMAAEHLRETADKICDDIGGFLEKVLNSDKNQQQYSDFSEFILNEEFESDDEIENIDDSSFSSQFSNIINSTVVTKSEKTTKAVSNSSADSKSPSILDGLLGKSLL